MTQEQLVDQIVKAIRPLTDGFLAQKSSGELAHETEAGIIRERIASERDPVIKAALTVGLTAHQSKGPPSAPVRMEEAAAALAEAVRRLGLSTKGAKAPKGRVSRKDVLSALDAIETAMSRNEFMTRSEVVEAAGLSERLGRAALARMKREGRVESNGERGKRGAYRLAGP